MPISAMTSGGWAGLMTRCAIFIKNLQKSFKKIRQTPLLQKTIQYNSNCNKGKQLKKYFYIFCHLTNAI
jgi:hypothetical protein